MDRTTPMFKENEEHITHEDSNDAAAVNENHNGETISIACIVSPTGLEADNPRDTPYPFGCFWRLLYTCF
ncbi:CCP, partial [Trifolium medium]|nr:CCP [Trifolium medium]